MVAVFLYPMGAEVGADAGGVGRLPIAIFVNAQAWREVWFLLIWLLGLLVFGVLGACSLFAVRVGDEFAERIQNGISRLARLLPLSLPLIFFGAYVLMALPGFGYFLLFLLKMLWKQTVLY